jgi:hypothetical protein
MADSDKTLRQHIEIDATAGLSELDRYNAKLKEMDTRQQAAAASAAKVTEATEDQLKANQRMAEVAQRKAVTDQEIAAANTEIAKTTKTVTKEEVEALEKTGKLTSAKVQLKAALKGLGAAYPELAHAAQLFLNPITASIALLGAAAAITYNKLKAFSAVNPTEKWDASKANEYATAMERIAAAVGKAGENAKEAAGYFDSITRKYELMNQLGGAGNPLIAKHKAEEEAGVLSGQIAEKRIAAANLRRDAGNINVGGSKAEDEATGATLAREASAAQAEIAKLDAEIKAIEDLQDPNTGNALRKLPGWTSFSAKYGTYTDPTAIKEQLQAQRAGYQGSVDRSTSFATAAQTREAQRQARTAMTGRAGVLEGEANELDRKRRTGLVDAQVQFAITQQNAGVPVPVTQSGQGFAITPEAAQRIAQFTAEVAALAQALAEGNARLRAATNTTAKTAPAMN